VVCFHMQETLLLGCLDMGVGRVEEGCLLVIWGRVGGKLYALGNARSDYLGEACRVNGHRVERHFLRVFLRCHS
jgi:hypothetical protein